MGFFHIKGEQKYNVRHIQIHHSSRKSSQFTHGTGKCCTGLWCGPGKPRAKSYFSGGLCCIFFGVMYPLSFFFLQVVGGIVFFRENMGGYTIFENFSEIVWYSYLVVVCMYVQQQYITFFFWLAAPLQGKRSFQFPSDALFNHHSSTKLGGRGIKLIFATPPFLDMFFQLWLKDFSVGFLIFLMMGLGTCFLKPYFLHHSLFTQYLSTKS